MTGQREYPAGAAASGRHEAMTNHTGGVLRVVLYYAAFASLWILVSDKVLETLVRDGAAYAQWSIYKGWAFVVITSALLAVVLRGELRQRERAGAALRDSREETRRYETLLEHVSEGTPDAVYVKDTDGRYLLFNTGACHIVGRPRAEVLGRDDTALLQPEEARAVMAKDGHIMATGTTDTFEETVTLGGKARTFLTTKGPVRDAHGGIVGLFGIARDITERRRAQVALAEANRLRELILESVGDGIHGIDLAGRIAFENATALTMFGREAQEMIGQEAHALTHHHHPDGSVYPAEDCPINRTLRDGKTRHVENEVYFRRDGTSFPVEYTCCAMRNEAGVISGAVIVFRDATERRRAEAEIQKERLLSDSILRSLPGIFYLFDEQGRYLRWNQNLVRLSGYSEEEFRQRHPLEFFTGEEKTLIRERIGRVFTEGMADAEAHFTARDGTLTPFYFTGVRLELDGRPHLAGVGIELTERNRAEAESRLLQAIASGIAEAADLNDALAFVLRKVCDETGWAMGEVWLPTRDRARLECHPVWHSRAPGLEPFRQVSRSSTFAPGEGLPGLVWSTGRTAWIEDVRRWSPFRRMQAAEAAGLKAAVGLPVLAREQVVLVMDFFLLEKGAQDRRMTGLVAAVAAQIGLLIERRLAESRVQHLARLYAALTDVNQIIVRVKSRDELFAGICRVAVERGGMALAWIGLLDHDAGVLTPVCAHGADRDRLPRRGIDVTGPAFGASSMAVAIASGRVTYNRDMRSDPAMQHWEGPEVPPDFLATASVPIRLSRQVVGLLNLYTKDPDLVADPDQQRLLEEMAEDVSFALDALHREARRRLAEDGLRESETRLRLALDAARMGTFEWDMPGKRMTWSGRHEELWGYAPGEFDGTYDAFAQRVHPEDLAGLEAEIDRCTATKVPFRREYRVVWPDGSVHWVLGQGEAAFDDPDRPGLLRGTVMEITPRKQAEQQLHLQSTALASSANAIMITDTGGTILWVNDAYCALTGYGMGEVVGRNPRELVKSGRQDEAYYRRLWDTILAGDVWHDEIVNRRKDGSLYTEDQTITPVRNEQGEITHFVAVKVDVTERKEAQDRILRLNRVYKMLSAINALIVHIRDREELLREACRIAVEDGGFRMAWIGTVPEGGKTITPRSWAGPVEGYLEHVHLSLDGGMPEKDCVCSRAARTGQPAVLNNLATAGSADAAWLEAARSRGFRAAAALPLNVGRALEGVLALYASETDLFDAEEMRLLVELAEDISYALENIARSEQLEYLSSYDALTGLANRTLFNAHLNAVLDRARQSRKQVALLVCDPKNFRHVNNVYGEKSGDLILRTTAERLRHLAGDPVNLGRITGDYFAMILHDVRDATGIGYMFANSLFPALCEPVSLGEEEVQVGFHGGIAVYPTDGEDADALYRNAEAALKKAKAGGERYLFYRPEMTARIAENLQLERRLRVALANGQFVLHYQPKVDAVTQRVTGVEALIRWQDPDTGLVPPGKFIPILEETGLILEVGLWALDRAARDYRVWRRELGEAPRIAVNVSAIQLQRHDFAESVMEAIQRSGDPVPLDLEITESMIMVDIEQNIAKLGSLRAAGMGVAIDDFGTGYSSLSYISRLPVDALKIDRSFVMNMTGHRESMTIVSSVITLAHSLNLKVIAEGVETEEQAKFLALLKCDQMQGYLFGRPVPPETILERLRAHP
ncbi:MAG: hypothetical protein NFCOHLIN_02273 [Gammaproteobacteria bacterium]|nr:hypothetical protein [Gammaproteobacteria bacterium]